MHPPSSTSGRRSASWESWTRQAYTSLKRECSIAIWAPPPAKPTLSSASVISSSCWDALKRRTRAFSRGSITPGGVATSKRSSGFSRRWPSPAGTSASPGSACPRSSKRGASRRRARCSSSRSGRCSSGGVTPEGPSRLSSAPSASPTRTSGPPRSRRPAVPTRKIYSVTEWLPWRAIGRSCRCSRSSVRRARSPPPATASRAPSPAPGASTRPGRCSSRRFCSSKSSARACSTATPVLRSSSPRARPGSSRPGCSWSSIGPSGRSRSWSGPARARSPTSSRRPRLPAPRPPTCSTASGRPRSGSGSSTSSAGPSARLPRSASGRRSGRPSWICRAPKPRRAGATPAAPISPTRCRWSSPRFSVASTRTPCCSSTRSGSPRASSGSSGRRR